jgi:uncharacterized membrane protein YgdD (TMEM256/DUF423 family)
MISRKFLLIACISGALAVVMGAFGAHALSKVIDEAQLLSYKTGVQYQFYHTFALMVVALLSQKFSNKWMRLSGWLFVAGILCFSGSIYFLALRNQLGIQSLTPILGPITPLGGLLFIGGWLSFFYAIWLEKKK